MVFDWLVIIVHPKKIFDRYPHFRHKIVSTSTKSSVDSPPLHSLLGTLFLGEFFKSSWWHKSDNNQYTAHCNSSHSTFRGILKTYKWGTGIQDFFCTNLSLSETYPLSNLKLTLFRCSCWWGCFCCRTRRNGCIGILNKKRHFWLRCK